MDVPRGAAVPDAEARPGARSPEPGDRIAVRYNGRQLSKSTGRRYHDYSVASAAERRPAVSWADVKPSGAANVDDDEYEPPPDHEYNDVPPPF